MMKYRVSITNKIFYSDEIKDILREAEADLLLRPCRTEEEIIEKTRDMDAILTTSAPFSKAVLESLNKCKGIVRIGIGVDNFDLKTATRRGICIVNVPDYYVEDVANHTVTFILACARKIVQIDAAVKKGTWTIDAFHLSRLSKQVVGLAGFGRISRAVAERLKPFGTEILVYDPYVPRDIIESMGLKLTEFGSLIKKSDFISLHCPLTDETRRMIGEKELRQMKKNACLINTARAGLIDQDALFRALKEGWISGAALDVFDKEPPEPGDPLLGLENLISSPHIGWYSMDSRDEAARRGADEIVRILEGKRPLNIVNTEILQE